MKISSPIAKSSALVALFAVLGPMAGLALEMVMAWRFGSSALVDAYRAAYLLISFGNLLAGFLLPHLIIPVVSRLREQNRELDGWRAAFTAGYVLASLGLLLLIYTFVDPQSIFALLAPGLKTIPRSDAVVLLGSCNLALVVTLCCGVFGGLLQLYQSFGIPALSQMLFNLSICFVIATVGNPESNGSIAAGVVIGSFLMLFLHAFALLRVSARFNIRFSDALRPIFDSGTLKLLASGYPLILIMLASILSNVVLTRQLSFVGAGAIARYGYASKLLIITGIAPTALATVIFPSLAIVYARGDLLQFNQLAARVIKMTLLFTAPVSVVLFLFRSPIIDLLFDRGSMEAVALDQIKLDFGILLFQAVPGNFNIFLQKLSFALNDMKVAAFASVLTLILMATLLEPAAAHFGNSGVMYVYVAVQAFIPTVFLGYQILRFHVIAPRALGRSVARVTILSGGIAASSIAIRFLFSHLNFPGKLPLLLELTSGGAVALLVGMLLSRILGIDEFKDLEAQILSRFRGNDAPRRVS